METMGRVDHKRWKRPYRARDKEEIIKEVVNLHNEGMGQVQIAKQLGVTRETIRRWNSESNFITIRSPGEAGKLANKIYDYDEHYFKSIDTYNKAYILGFILGDGCITEGDGSYRWMINLAEQDKQILLDIAKELDVVEALKFRPRNAPNEQNKCSLTVFSTTMAQDLMQMGIVIRKTGKERWINLGDTDLQWAFLRGLFDADGSIRVYKRFQRGKWNVKARWGITKNKELLESVLLFLQSYNIGTKVTKLYKKQGCYDLHLGSVSELKLLYNYLYAYGDLKLNRKYEIFSSLMI